MVRGLPRLIVLLVSILGVSSLAYAQGSSTKATLTGTVQDTTGAVVPGASIVVRNVATGVKTETVSNSTGSFAVAAIDAGTYEATVSLTGFKTVVVDKIVLSPGNTSSIGVVKLDVGAASETVNVSAHTELIDTASTTVAATLSSDQIQKLPLVTKNAMYALAFLPGVNAPSGSHSQRSSTVLGLPQSAIAIVLDGVNVQDQAVKSTDGFYADIRPQTDAVEQVTVSEGTPGAESSGQGAVQIKFVTRSGTNTSTGSAYEYLPRHVAEHELVLQHPEEPAEERDQLEPVRLPPGRPDRDSGRLRRQEQGVLLRQLRGVPPPGHPVDDAHGAVAARAERRAPVQLLGGHRLREQGQRVAARGGQWSGVGHRPDRAGVLQRDQQRDDPAGLRQRRHAEHRPEHVQLRVAAADVPRRAPAGRPYRHESGQEQPPHRNEQLPEGEFGSGHRQQRVLEFPRHRRWTARSTRIAKRRRPPCARPSAGTWSTRAATG